MLRWEAHANDKIIPALTELRKTLSTRMFPLATPARETSSVVSLGEYVLAPILVNAESKIRGTESEREKDDAGGEAKYQQTSNPEWG
jgi:hypothetical protein